ncbi:MAG: FAD-dependent urate hydroxylase [Burkholderiales bacterium]|jgi:thioredoxin reductase
MTVATDITIVGAGPYGLSIAAYLRELGLDFRIIGSPMHSWLTSMPKGMLLKSAGFASNLYDPGRTFTLERFCKEHGIPYQDIGLPVRLDTFTSYGIAFQKRMVPQLEDEKLVTLNRAPGGFELRMESGIAFRTRKVVLAVGIDYFRHMPRPLAHLPAELCSHSATHHEFSRFRRKDVAVIGSGASAIDIAVLLHEAQARVQLIARAPEIRFGYEEAPSRSLLQRLRAPMSGVGAGWKNRMCTDVPWLYRYLPDRLRLRTVKRFLGPAGGWFMKDRATFVPRIVGCELHEATAFGGRVELGLVGVDGATRQVSAEHVITATGYRTDVQRLPFLSLDILEQLKLIGQSPRLSGNFESSVPGLYFAGPITATSFGPVMRFAVGAEFACQRISRHLAREAGARSVPPKVEAVPGAQ